MNCQKCNSERVADITGKCSDCCSYSLGKNEMYGNCYVPSDMGVGGGDYLELSWCLDCGQLQGTFPIAETAIEKETNDSEIKEFYENNLNEDYEVDFFLAMKRRKLIQEAKNISIKFGQWVENFFSENLNNYPSLRIPSVEKFIWMYRQDVIDIRYQE